LSCTRRRPLDGVENPALHAVACSATIAWVFGLAISGWHLLATIIPWPARPHGANRFAFPITRPTTDSIRDQRDEASDLVSVLAGIALTKHTRVRRSRPALIVASASAGVLLALAVPAGIAT
jgi:hypothetical protein